MVYPPSFFFHNPSQTQTDFDRGNSRDRGHEPARRRYVIRVSKVVNGSPFESNRKNHNNRVFLERRRTLTKGKRGTTKCTAILEWHERNSTIKQNSQIHLLIKLQNQLKWETWKNEGQEEKQ